MTRKRVYEYARKYNMSSKEMIEKAKSVGLTYQSHMSVMEEDEINRLDQVLKPKASKGGKNQQASKPNQGGPKATGQAGRKKSADHNKPSGSKKPERNQAKPSQPAQPGKAPKAKGEKKEKEAKRILTADEMRFEQSARQQNRPNKRRFNKKNQKRHPNQKRHQAHVSPRKQKELPEVLVFTDGMTVAEVAKKLHREPAELIKKLLLLGVMATQNQSLDRDAIELIAADYGIESEEKVLKDIADLDSHFEETEEDEAKKVGRSPVVTIMGHVDHGKTTLLDKIRDANVSLNEAGGITQHIGAYQINIDGKPITFLDTPGHAAFSAMRARGADITDITVIIVAADDGVMPQTIEAINHAKAADIPIIVAVNKIDKPGANPDHVMTELSELGLIPEEWGGDTQFIKISAKFGDNLDELLETILLIAEMQELKANPDRLAIGSVIEARLDKAKGSIATLLVQEGTLRTGDPIVVGNAYGRVRAMVNDQGRRVKEAGPSQPVEITGLNTAPQAGDRFVVFEDEKTARHAGEERAKRALLEHRQATQRITLDNLFDTLQEGEMRSVNIILKTDVQGTAEALASSLQKIEVEGVKVKIVHTAVGAINESDITLATASNAIIIGFNVRPTPQAKVQADLENVDIRLHNVIYHAIEEIETAMQGMLDPVMVEETTGQLVVRETFVVSKVGTIAGAYVTDGYITNKSSVRLIREGIVIYDGQLASLKRFKDDAREVKKGFECGIMIEDYNDIKVDDIIEAYHMVEEKR